MKQEKWIQHKFAGTMISIFIGNVFDDRQKYLFTGAEIGFII